MRNPPIHERGPGPVGQKLDMVVERHDRSAPNARTARRSAPAASSRVNTNQLSVLFEQSTAMLIGFKAKNSAARRPAPVPKRRCTSV
ncbi:MAG: hypothetical protein WCA23_03740 [Stellaceae bacterium]